MCSRNGAHFTLKKILTIFLFVLVIVGCEEIKHRVKRRVIFGKNSKLFFRFNGKSILFPWGTLFAQGYAVRINYELPDTIQKRYQFFKRDIHNEVEKIKDMPGLQGYSCILNIICQYTQQIATSTKCGILCEIGNIINTSTGADADFFKSIVSKCEHYETTCKLTSKMIIGM